LQSSYEKITIMNPTKADNAPVKAESEGFIDAPITVVWKGLTDLAAWPKWNTDVTSIRVDGPIAPGTKFRWKAGGFPISSQLEEVVRPTKVAWKGRTLGISAVHKWTLEARGGGTLVHTEESFDGLLPRLLPGMMQRSLAKTLAKHIQMLTAESLRRNQQA